MTMPASSPKDLCFLGARAAALAMEQGRLTSQQLVEALLERIAQREPVVRAWAHLDTQGAMDQARALDRQGRQHAQARHD